MSNSHERVPPLFWVNDLRSGLPASVIHSGQRAICFFSLETAAFNFAERFLGGEPGVDWQTVGSETPNDFFRIVEGAPQQGFDGWVLNPPLDASDEYLVSPWSALREEVEHKLDVGAAWGSAPRSSSRNPSAGRPTHENTEPLASDDWQKIPSDPETVALLRLSSQAVDILEGPSSPFEKPRFVEEFEQNRRRIELAGREGAETLNEWRRQTEERIAYLLGRRPWVLIHVLALLRRLPNDQFFLGEKQEEDGPSHFDSYQAEVTERAALKYARWDASGVELAAWEPGMPGLAHDKPTVDAERVAEIFSLVRLGGLHLAYLERLRRAIVRGQTVILRPDGVSDSRPDPELRKRLNLYEERAHKFSFLGETAGTFEPSRGDDTQANGMLATHAVRTTYREDEGGDWWRYERSRRLIQKRDKRFLVSPANLVLAYEYLKLLEEEVAAQYGLSPELIVSALSALNEAVGRFVAPQGDETLIGTFAERLAYLESGGT